MAEEKPEIDESEIAWRAAEHEHFDKGGIWHLAVGGATLILFFSALWQRNFFFGIFILFAGIMVIILGNRRPEMLDFKLTEKGCETGRGNFYEYSQLENFCLRKRPGRLDEMILKKKSVFNPLVRIPLDNKTAEQARTFLAGKLPEEEYNNSLLDAFVDFLGF